MKCGACAGSACVSCLVVDGAESDVVCSVHWCGVAVRGHVVGGAVGCCGVICRLVSCFILHLFFGRCAGRGGEEVPEAQLPVVLALQPSPSRAGWWWC